MHFILQDDKMPKNNRYSVILDRPLSNKFLKIKLVGYIHNKKQVKYHSHFKTVLLF